MTLGPVIFDSDPWAESTFKLIAVTSIQTKKASLAQRLGIKERQLQRHLAELENVGLLRREARYLAGGKGQTSNIYHLDGLVKRLKELEPEFREAKEEAKKRRERVEKRRPLRPVPPTKQQQTI